MSRKGRTNEPYLNIKNKLHDLKEGQTEIFKVKWKTIEDYKNKFQALLKEKD